MMNFTKTLLVVAAGLILATQAQAELIDFTGVSLYEIGAWESGDYVLTLSEAPVTGVEVTFGGDTEEIGWEAYEGLLQLEHHEAGAAYVWFSEPVEVPSLYIRKMYGGDATDVVTGLLGASVIWGPTGDIPEDQYDWQEVTAGAGQTIDTLKFEMTQANELDNITVIPEPATLALLGLGGLGLLIRRRR